MAFGDALRQTDGATVVLNVDTSQTQKLEQAEAQWRESVGTMSREALKLDLAQDRLKKSLASYGAESAQAKRATIALKDAEEQAARAADKQTRETEQLARATGRLRVGNVSLTRSVAGLAGAYIGVYGLVAGVRASVEAAKEEQNVLGQTKIAVQAAGLQWDQYEAQIQAVIRAQSQLGFDDEALMRTFQMFVRSTRDVNKALELNALAADVARGRYIDLESAAQIVNKANLGMAGGLRRIGLDVDKQASRTELLATLTRNYGKAAEAASDDAVAATDRLGVEFENIQEIVGTGLLPTVTELSDRLSEYLGNAENQEELQRRVNEAVKTGEDIVRGFAGAIRTLKEVLGPIVDLLGGAENAAKLFFLAFAVRKVLAITGAVKGISVAFGLIGPAATRNAAVAVAAENTIGTAAVANAAKVGILSRALAGLGTAAAAGGVMAAGAAVGVAGVKVLSELDEGLGLSVSPSAKRIADIMERQPTKARRETWSNLSPTMRRQVAAELRARNRFDILAEIGAANVGGPNIVEPGEGRLGGPGTTSKVGGGGGGGSGATTPPTELDLLLAVDRPGNERRDLERLRAFYARQIRALEARKNLTKAQKEQLRQLYGDMASVQAQIDAIEEEAEQKEQAARKARAKKLAAMREQGEKELAELNRSSAERAQKSRERINKYLTDAGKEARKTSSTQGLTAADVHRMQFDFLTRLTGEIGQYGSNFQPDGSTQQMATHSYAQTQLMRDQNAALHRLIEGTWHPGAQMASADLSAAGWGVGF